MDEHRSANINSTDLDEETKQKLKGDSIGDTLYSASFVISTLQGFSNLKYDEKTEEDLCFLWDMTLELDVCKLLFELDFPTLATNALETCEQQRLIEILIGILANILLADCDNKNITTHQVTMILREFETSNPDILIQLMRFLESIAYAMTHYINGLGDRVLKHHIQFILNNSQNIKLISESFKAVEQLTEDFKLSECYVTHSLLESMIEGFDSGFSVETNTFDDDMECQEQSKIIRIFVRAVANLCEYASKYNIVEINLVITNSTKLFTFFSKIVQHFSKEFNLLPVSPCFMEYISAFYLIIQTVDFDAVPKECDDLIYVIFNCMCKILILLHPSESEVADVNALLTEFIGYIIYRQEFEFLLSELEAIGPSSLIVVNFLNQEYIKFSFDVEVKLKMLHSKLIKS
ncbi:hypothetical protein HUJ04_001602 [Dendroctonus ponderosae]|uniref:Uncharacterized protein n=1 Tax=Dendroctonus ponderosae TaxID=77166 RepID=A0AAR5QIW6_DENPD|nr:hypothetical protein HUJ04_001602 [Dendroctonus ponderosae]